MSEILFATWDGGGNVPPAVAIAAELQRRGQTVRFIGHETQRDALTGAGFAFTPYAASRPFSSVEHNSLPRLVSLFTDQQMGTDVLAELEARPADLVVVDCVLLGVLRAMADSGTPYASLEHFFDAYLRKGWLRGPVGLAGRLKGLRPVNAWDSARLALVTSPPSMDPGNTGRAPANVRFTGPALDLPAPSGMRDRAVLVSLSTFNFPGMGAALQRILDATAGLDARIIVTTGPVLDPADLRTAANHEVHRFVPHDELMPQVSLVVGHGGHATTMRALAHELPLVIMPMHPLLDQPMVGKAVAAAGAGEVVRKKASPDQLRPVIERLLADGPHRQAAARLAAEIRELDGARRAADLVQGVLNGAPAPSGS
jgi:UDP:flavonoid glycosyltransferase YjiC (YdhE family)